MLELGDLRLGQIATEGVAVVKLGVNNGSGDGMDGYSKADKYGKISNSKIWSQMRSGQKR